VTTERQRRAAVAARPLQVGLVNNMPDSALEATERQFRELLDAAAGAGEIDLRFYSLPEIPRGEAGKRHLDNGYLPVDELFKSGADALIVTGTEPRAADLTAEPYWQHLIGLIDWAEREKVSCVWSCLAAHAAALHQDAIKRRPLADKCSGVYVHEVDRSNPLMRGVDGPVATPHSRWNELERGALERAGYQVLTVSAEAGVNLFMRERGVLFLYFQGHPEYDTRALLKEYQRDIGRFLRGERPTYPTMPRGYFDGTSTALLSEFAAEAQKQRREALLSEFPFAAVAATLRNTWRAAGATIYGNWLERIAGNRAERRAP
jgi:homoserine O-succinyltransferase